METPLPAGGWFSAGGGYYGQHYVELFRASDRNRIGEAIRLTNVLYQVARGTAEIEVRHQESLISGGRLLFEAILVSSPTDGPLPNDVMVTIPSASGSGTFDRMVGNTDEYTGPNGRNHADVADGTTTNNWPIVQWLRARESTHGDLQ